MTISKDRVKPSPLPDSWKLNEIFATGVVLGTYLALMTVVFFWVIHKTDFFTVSSHFFVEKISLYLLHRNCWQENFTGMFLLKFLCAEQIRCQVNQEQRI